MLRKIALWIDERLRVSKLFASTAGHTVPASAGSWFYVFGSGTLIRFDQDAYWGLGIGAAIMGRTPLIGPNLVHLLLGGPIIAGETLSRFFTLHVFVIPGLLIALISLHLRLVLTKGINEYPVPGQEVRKETYLEEYESLLKTEGVPFYPKAIGKDLVFSGLVMLGILFCAA